MSSHTREHVDTFWELVDEILNAVLFVVIGLEVLQVPFSEGAIIAGLVSIPIILGSWALSVAVPVGLLRLRRTMAAHTIKILTWGGLRGGISVALALSLPEGHARNVIVSMTYYCRGLLDRRSRADDRPRGTTRVCGRPVKVAAAA